MALQPFLKIHTFTGNSNENFDEFESLLQAGIAVGAIAEAQQPAFLKLNLSGGALRFYSGLADATRNDLDDALTALRDRYNQTANQEFHRIKFHERKFDSVKESPEDYIVELQRLALRAFPNVAAGAHGAAIDRADERTRRVKEAFIQGMPIKFKRKLLKEPQERTVEELGRQITRELWIMNAYPDDSYPGAFQQLGYSDDNTVQLNLLQNNQVKMHDELSKKLDNMTSQLENSIHNSNCNRGRGSFRGYNSRGRSNCRGNPGRGYWQNNSSNYPNTGNYGNQGNRGSPHPNRKLFCRRCGKYGHTQSNCWSVPQTRNIGQSVPFDHNKKTKKATQSPHT